MGEFVSAFKNEAIRQSIAIIKSLSVFFIRRFDFIVVVYGILYHEDYNQRTSSQQQYFCCIFPYLIWGRRHEQSPLIRRTPQGWQGVLKIDRHNIYITFSVFLVKKSYLQKTFFHFNYSICIWHVSSSSGLVDGKKRINR